jgi:DNA-binding transcriptional LysR family regulator
MVTGSAGQAGPEPIHWGSRPPGVEFRQLRYFVGLAEELHFGRAAARLHVTQPGLSQAIARLERGLEVCLFTRTRGNVELTEAGAELLGPARRLLDDLDEAVAQVRLRGRGDTGLVRLGIALLAEPAVAPAIKAFQRRYPGFVLDRSGMVSERLLAQLAEARVHVAVIHRLPALDNVEGVDWEVLRRSRLVAVVSRTSRHAHRTTVKLSELSEETFLVNPRILAPSAFSGLNSMCREFGGFEPVVLESAAASTAGLDTDWHSIETGTAVALMAETTARTICPAEVSVVPIESPPAHVLALAWRADEPYSAARLLRAFLRSYRDRHGWTAIEAKLR